MLYNPQWGDKNVTPTLEGFISWLETKDPQKTYHYSKPDACAMAQYLQSLGSKERSCYSWDIDEMFNMGGIAYHFVRAYTFGELLNRLKGRT